MDKEIPLIKKYELQIAKWEDALAQAEHVIQIQEKYIQSRLRS